MNSPSNPTRVRIYSHLTLSRFLHIEDALAIGKVRLFAGTYRKYNGMSTYANAFVNVADARVIFGALALGEQGFRHKEYKGSPPRNGGTAVSRVLSITVKGENVYIELKTGPGKLTNTGAITPNGKAKTEVNVGLKLYEARRMGASVLAYIHAWDVMQMMVNQHVVSKPSPYLLVSATSETDGGKAALGNGKPKPNRTPMPPVMATNNGSPVTRKGLAPRATSTNVSATAKQPNGQPKNPGTAVSPAPSLQYGDGNLVDMQNLTEVQTFQQYTAARKTEPKSKAMLLDFYQEGIRVTVSAASR
jgi:hypothetical protein